MSDWRPTHIDTTDLVLFGHQRSSVGFRILVIRQPVQVLDGHGQTSICQHPECNKTRSECLVFILFQWSARHYKRKHVQISEGGNGDLHP